MKTLKEFYSNADAASGPYAGVDLKLFPGDMDLLSQDFQTPEEVNKPIYADWGGVYPVMHVSLSSNLGDGPSIDQMVDASMKFTNIIDARTEVRIRKNFSRFMGKR